MTMALKYYFACTLGTLMHDVWSLNKMSAKSFNLYLLQGHTNEYLALKSSFDGISDCIFFKLQSADRIIMNEYNSLSIQFGERSFNDKMDLWSDPHRSIE